MAQKAGISSGSEKEWKVGTEGTSRYDFQSRF